MYYNSISSKNTAISILKEYNGINPYILRLKNDIIIYQRVSSLTERATEYIIKNHEKEPVKIGKIVDISDIYGEMLKKEYEIEFAPVKLQILVLLGETSSSYHCMVKYRQNMNPLELFVPKKYLLNDFLIEDYHNVSIDFDRYDRLSLSRTPDSPRKLKPHQKEAVQFLISRKKCILADDMGLGKSCEMTVASIEGNFDAVLIICPASLKSNWFNELTNYVAERDISIIGGVNEMKKGEIERYLGYREGKSGKNLQDLQQEAKERGKWNDNRYVIINYDILDDVYKISRARSKEGIEKALEESPMLKFLINKKSLIIIDEAHKLSNSKSDRYKIIKDLIKKSNPHSVYLATGTPVTNNPSNLYCILQLIEENVTSDWQFYMERYCGAMKIPAKGEKEKWTNKFLAFKKKPNWAALTSVEKDDLKEYIRNNARHITILKDPANLEELKKKISNIYLRRTKEDISESLPSKTVHELFYDFDLNQLMEYSKLWDEYEAAQLEADPTKEINRDLLEGAVYRKYCSNQMVPKTIALADSFIEKGEKVIIATCYDEELNLLKDYYGDKCVVYNGKMLAKQKDAAQKEFIENEDKKVFIGNIIAAGVGINLIVSHIMIFNNIDFVPSSCRQMEDRIYRIGQTKDVHIYYQMFRGTQYEKIWNTVLRKELAINKIIKKEKEK